MRFFVAQTHFTLASSHSLGHALQLGNTKKGTRHSLVCMLHTNHPPIELALQEWCACCTPLTRQLNWRFKNAWLAKAK